MLDGKVSLPGGTGFFYFGTSLPSSSVSTKRTRSVQSVAYRLALLVSVGGLVLLALAGPGDDLQTTLGVMGLVGAGLMVGLGALLKLLGYVGEGAADIDESP